MRFAPYASRRGFPELRNTKVLSWHVAGRMLLRSRGGQIAQQLAQVQFRGPGSESRAIGIAQFSDQRRVGDKSADSSANPAGNVTGVPLNAILSWHFPDDFVPKHSGCAFSTLLARQIPNDIRPGPSRATGFGLA
jgi:hypothetical protein